VKTLAIVNPAAGQGRAGRQWPRLASYLSELGLDFDAELTAFPGDGTSIARQALRSGYNRLVAVGGDGTFNEIVNGFFEGGEPINPDAVLAPLSFGTGCDLSRSLGIGAGFAAAARLLQAKPRAIDLGQAAFLDHQGRPTERYFLNYADLVLGGETLCQVQRLPKAMGGFLTFLVGSTLALLAHRNKHLRLTVDGRLAFDGPVALAIICNGSHFGGGMHIAPGASPQDGLLDVVIMHHVGRAGLLWNLPRVYRGTHIGDRRVLCLRGREIEAAAEETVLVGMDGEQPGMANARFQVRGGALTVQG